MWTCVLARFVSALGLATIAVGCRGLPRYPLGPDATVREQGIAIVSASGALRLDASHRVPVSPGRAVACLTDWTATGWTVMHKNARSWGVRELAVRVEVPELQAPLYGYLVLCGIAEGAEVPAARGYRVEVPKQYVEATTDGRYSVVLETYPAALPNGNKSEFASWVLWLSREPFPGIHA